MHEAMHTVFHSNFTADIVWQRSVGLCVSWICLDLLAEFKSVMNNNAFGDVRGVFCKSQKSFDKNVN